MSAPATPPAVLPSTAVSLDEQALARLRELDPDGRHGVVRRVLQAYEGSLQRDLQQLQALGDDPTDGRTVAGIAHRLKSSSASVGALALSATCAEVESQLRQAPDQRPGPQIAKLVTAAEAALVAVRSILPP